MALKFCPTTSLALLLFLSTATMVLRHVGATTSTRDSCDWQACADDPVCLECHSDFEYDECATNLLADYSSTLYSDDCAYWSVYPCCHDEVSANDCLGNEAFTEYWLCVMSDLSYSVDGGCTAITCGDFGGGGGGGDESDVAAVTPAPTASGDGIVELVLLTLATLHLTAATTVATTSRNWRRLTRLLRRTSIRPACRVLRKLMHASTTRCATTA